MIHAETPPISCEVENRTLYDEDPTHEGQWTKGTIIAASSYVGDAVTAIVRLKNGSVFSYIPLHRLRTKPIEGEPLELSDLVYHNCPQGPVESLVLGGLQGSAHCYFPQKKRWLRGEYVCSLDWYRDNLFGHLMTLENGQIGYLPNHKALFGEQRTEPEANPSFLPYRKMHSTWRVAK